MPYKVVIDNPELGEQSVCIPLLGEFHNGEETVVSDEQGEIYAAHHEGQTPDFFRSYGVTITRVAGGQA